jgi:hypothetical protein
MTPYHMATRCGIPPGPIDATVAVRLRRRNSATSSGDIVICARWLVPIVSSPWLSAAGRPGHRPGWCVYWPFQAGARLAKKAAMPSVTSSLASSSACLALLYAHSSVSSPCAT